MNEPCPHCGTPMVGVMLVDGIDQAGRPFGEARAYCVPCDEARYVYRDHPFGRVFRRARIDREVSMRAVAAHLGLTVVQVSQVEAGLERPPASTREFVGWARAIGMEPEALQGLLERESGWTDETERGVARHG